MGTDYKDEDIHAALENILSYDMFMSSPRAQDFLKYIITEFLAGRAKTLSGTTIGQDVFKKGADFDPIQDSVVRVYARRLRFMLRDYYLDNPKRDPIIITIPKGGYKPLFEKNMAYAPLVSPPAPLLQQATPVNSNLKILIGLILALVTGAFLWTHGLIKLPVKIASSEFSHLTSSYPMIAVAPFKNETGQEDYSFLEEGLQKKMVEDLSRFSLIRPSLYKSSYETLLTKKNRTYDYAFSGLILSVKPELDLYIKLIDINQSTLIYERRIRRSNKSSDYFDSLSEIVSELSGNFAGLEGAIVEDRLEDIEQQIANDTLRISNLEAFECFGMVGKIVKDPSPALYKRTYMCLSTLLEEDPNNSTLLSAFGWVTSIGATSYEPVLMARSVNPDINVEAGIAMMERAVKIDPTDAWAQQTLSAARDSNGDIQSALKHAELAVIANPGDPDNLTWLSTLLANVGQWDRALALSREALDRNPKPSSHYYYTFFLWALHNDDTAAMHSSANKIAELEDYYAFIYSYLAALANEDEALITELQPKIDAITARNNNDIMSVIDVLVRSDELRTNARAILVRGGILPPLTVPH